MNSEKAKEIKDKLREEVLIATSFGDKFRRVPTTDLQDFLTLINELESENKRLQEQNGILIRDLNYMNRKLTNAEIEIDDYIARIAELEKEIEENAFYSKGYAQGIKNTYEVVVPDKLKQFAEAVKDLFVEEDEVRTEIDEILKEFIKE